MSAKQLTQPSEFQDGGVPVAPPICLVDAQGYAVAGTTATPVPASASDTPVKGGPGRLCRVIVTVAGTTATRIYDNASVGTGTVIGAVPANPAVGTMIECQGPVANGITVAGASTNSALTVIWS